MDSKPQLKHPNFPCAFALQIPDCIAAAVGGRRTAVVVAASAAAASSSCAAAVAADRLEKVGACLAGAA